MAAKKPHEDPDNISDRREGKRVRRSPSITMLHEDTDNISDGREGKRVSRSPSITMNASPDSIQILWPQLEPLVRAVMREEVELGRHRPPPLLQRSPQMLIEEPKSSSALQLIFKKPLCLPIFTENKIEDVDGSPLKIIFKETPTTALPTSIKLEIVVLQGDFPNDDSKNWSSFEFNSWVVKEREGKGPLLIGTTAITLKDGEADVTELKFSDNSSWTRSGKFRIGVRVSSEHQQSLNIREAVSSSFKVKDRHGEGCMKHNPPLLRDEVWRLENIGKDGVFHKRLVEKNINTVQDFLKLSVIDSAQLIEIMGNFKGKWEATIKHARTCPLGDKVYIHYGSHFFIILNPICEVLDIVVDGTSKTFQELSLSMKAEVQQSVLDAYNCWDSLEEISIT